MTVPSCVAAAACWRRIASVKTDTGLSYLWAVSPSQHAYPPAEIQKHHVCSYFSREFMSNTLLVLIRLQLFFSYLGKKRVALTVGILSLLQNLIQLNLKLSICLTTFLWKADRCEDKKGKQTCLHTSLINIGMYTSNELNQEIACFSLSSFSSVIRSRSFCRLAMVSSCCCSLYWLSCRVCSNFIWKINEFAKAAAHDYEYNVICFSSVSGEWFTDCLFGQWQSHLNVLQLHDLHLHF